MDDIGKAAHQAWKDWRVGVGYPRHVFQEPKDSSTPRTTCTWPGCWHAYLDHHADMVEWDDLPEEKRQKYAVQEMAGVLRARLEDHQRLVEGDRDQERDGDLRGLLINAEALSKPRHDGLLVLMRYVVELTGRARNERDEAIAAARTMSQRIDVSDEQAVAIQNAIPFLMSVIASGETLSDQEVQHLRSLLRGQAN